MLVTGGASFIGSHLVNLLLNKGAIVTVDDDFSSSRLKNLEYSLRRRRKGAWTSKNLSVHHVYLKERSLTRKMMKNVDMVFHLVAQHGGGGYIYTEPGECSTKTGVALRVFENLVSQADCLDVVIVPHTNRALRTLV